MYFLRMEVKKLISTFSLTHRYCQSKRMTGEAKPSEEEATESELSVTVISVDKSKEEEKTLALSSSLEILFFSVRRTNKFQVMVKGSKRKK